jgi:hypothetical protein
MSPVSAPIKTLASEFATALPSLVQRELISLASPNTLCSTVDPLGLVSLTLLLSSHLVLTLLSPATGTFSSAGAATSAVTAPSSTADPNATGGANATGTDSVGSATGTEGGVS